MMDLRIVLVGKTGAGKSATGNAILNMEAFHREASSASVTQTCQMASAARHGRQLLVVDTPGWCDADLSEADAVRETIRCLDMTYPGPHVFLLVVPIGRFTQEESKAVRMIQEVFGEGAVKYTMVVFTRGDDLEEKSIEDYLSNARAELKNLVDVCGRRYHVISNTNQSNHKQVQELLMKIHIMVQENSGKCYTNTTYRLMDVYKRKQAEIQKQMRSVQRQLQIKEAEFQWKMVLMEQEKQQQEVRESELKRQLLESEIRRAREETRLITALEHLKVELVQEKEMRRSAEEAQQMLESWRESLVEEQRRREQEYTQHQETMQAQQEQQQAEWTLHQLRMEEEELKRKITESQQKQYMEQEKEKVEQERLHMIMEYTEKMKELQKQEQQTKQEREEKLRRNLRSTSCCSIT